MTADTHAHDRWRLNDRREFLVRSLEDAEQEHAAGDLDRQDYELLQKRDRALLAQVEAELAALDRAEAAAREAAAGEAAAGEDAARNEAAPERTARGVAAGSGARPRRRFRRRTWMIVVGLVAVVAAAGILVASLTSRRLPGQDSSGSVQLSGKALVAQQLHQAAVLVEQGHVTRALQLYQQILVEEPTQAQALAEGGWLEWEAGSQSGNATLAGQGRTLVDRSTTADPGLYAGHVYLGTIDLQLGRAQTAVAQYRLFLADHPPANSLQGAAADIRQAFADVGQPVPPGVPTVKTATP